MVQAIPSLAAQLRLGDRIILEVCRPPFADVGHRQMPVCVFHSAVAGATRLRQSGDRVAMRGVSEASEPAIDWGISGTGSILAGGILRIERDGMWWHVIPVAVGDDTVSAALEASSIGHGINRHGDTELAVTLLHMTSPAGDEPKSARVADTLVTALTTIGVADLEHRLGAPASSGAASNGREKTR